MNFNGSKKDENRYSWVAWRHPAFVVFRILPPGISKASLKTWNSLGGKAGICYAGCPCFWITFSGFPEKLIPADSADTAETHGFKAFPGFWQEKPLIQSGSIIEYHLFTEKQSSFPSEHRYPISTRHSLTPVTHRDRPCASFKAHLGKMYHEAGILAFWLDVYQEDFPPNQAELSGSKSVRVKGRVAWCHPAGGHYPTKPGK